MSATETLNKLLKSELSATETYQQALDKFQEDSALGEATDLRPLYEDHQQAATSLREMIQQTGGTPAEDSGAWGTWSNLVMGGAKLMGKDAALKALMEGEKSGQEDYEEALQESDLPSDVRSLVETRLQPAMNEHIRTLSRLLER